MDNNPPPSHQQAEGHHIAQAQGAGAIATVITNIFRGSTAEQRALRNRQAMLQLVRNTWIKGVLEQSLHGAAMIELGLEERAEAVERPWDMVVQTPDQPKRPLPPGAKIADVFDEMNRALLVLGEPGSGKTTMLLELARDTIARAEQDPIQPIPVVFNLSSWAEKRQPLVEWLVEELNTKYHIPKKIAHLWVENDELLLLLDGLDEIRAEHREACVEAINDFRQEHGLAPIVVCSRIVEYEALTTRLKFEGAVLLQPLTPQQVEEYLAEAESEFSVVREALQHDTALQELTQSPLMLSIIALVCRDVSLDEFTSRESFEGRRGHLFRIYVKQMFKRRGIKQPYTPEQTINWLSWIANKLLQYSQIEFLIEKVDPSWLTSKTQQWVYEASANLIVALLVGLPIGIAGELACRQFWRNIAPVFGPSVGIAFALTACLAGRRVFGLAGGMIVGLVFGVTFGLALA
ncbi:MAG: hypothetical protein DRP09_21450 [Candidatus Thorarchaeota archaeon]|nr:MAG: hypothetical protein DRP09_21450 [Candidatus Thorarchaeota archaeon]